MRGQPRISTADTQVKYRVRRGQLVQIPPEWVGHVVHDQKKRRRGPVSWRTRKTKKRR